MFWNFVTFHNRKSEIIKWTPLNEGNSNNFQMFQCNFWLLNVITLNVLKKKKKLVSNT